MAKIYFSILITFLFLVPYTSNAQDIPNHSFENWTNHGSYSDPDEWTTPNSQLSTMGIITVTQSNGAQSGSSSMALESKSFFGALIPGAATLGDISLDLFTQTAEITGGIPYSERPARLKGYFKYAPATSDTFAILAVFYKYNTASGATDTIGVGAFRSGSTINDWTEFSAQINWYSDATPDTTNVLMLSSDYSQTSNAGSVLQVDNISYDFEVGETESPTMNQEISVYPNPANDYIIFHRQYETSLSGKLEIYNLTGKMMMQRKLDQTNERIDVSNLPEGLYFYKLKSNHSILHSGKIVISR